MEKLRLEVDALEVESFETMMIDPSRGTVFGASEDDGCGQGDDEEDVPHDPTNALVCATGWCVASYGCIGYSEGGPCSYNVTECDV